jgi:hypothetical protein
LQLVPVCLPLALVFVRHASVDGRQRSAYFGVTDLLPSAGLLAGIIFCTS